MTRSYAWLDLFMSRHATQMPANKQALQHTATHCNTLQYTATQCNALQRTATHCNTLQRTATHCNTHVTHMDCNTTDFWLRMSWLLMRRLVTVITLQHTATHCDTLQHTAYNCNTTHFLLHVVIAHVMTGAITNESYYNPYVRHDSFTCVTWFIHLCGTTHLFVGRNSFIRWTWLVHMCDMTRSYACHDSFIRVTRLVLMRDMIHMRDMIYVHVHVGHDSFHFFFLRHTCEVTCMCDVLYVTHMWFGELTSHMPHTLDVTYVWCPICDAYVTYDLENLRHICVTYVSSIYVWHHKCVTSNMWRICDIWFGDSTSHMRHIWDVTYVTYALEV